MAGSWPCWNGCGPGQPSAGPRRFPEIWPGGIASGPAITACAFGATGTRSSWTKSATGGTSMRISAAAKKPGPKYRVQGGRRVVVLDEAEYERLRAKADEWEPLLPEPDADGNYPAV